MSNGSLDQLLHENNLYPLLAWSLRLRVLYEIALGVNFLHNMTPPLLHHDLKTQNILLDGEFHVKIADFGLSKWRQLSISKGSGSKPPEMGGAPSSTCPPRSMNPPRAAVQSSNTTSTVTLSLCGRCCPGGYHLKRQPTPCRSCSAYCVGHVPTRAWTVCLGTSPAGRHSSTS
ncbi:hypothetical protein J4Q44_G00184500 [Coregonus suidteri]|uniref:Protein kinase domain-containing protein n=1 Tax=Coregonus suidteri TaxID=861788 RepID=A0AAN8LFZ9_9TELE